MNNNNQFTFLDFLTILSFLIGFYALLIAVENLEENREQTEDTKEVLKKVDGHLHEQDRHLEFQDKLLGKEKQNEN